MNDEELIQKFYQNDQEALSMLFARHKEGLFNFALRFSGNRADAEDAVGHTFMMVCERRYTAKPGASFKTWAYTVARNLCISKFRSSSKFFSLWMKKSDAQDETMMDVEDKGLNVRDQLTQEELKAILHKAIGALPEEQKEALLLREYHGFSYEEISQVLECSLDKVKILIFRARNHLKNTLPPVVLEEGR